MAKRGRKAAAIREYIEQNPNAKATEIVNGLAAKRIKVSPTQVYAMLSNGKAPASPAPAEPAPVVREEGSLYGPDISKQPLLHATEFARVCGGIAQARKMLDTLDSLQV
jgi:hypothetical protein